MWITLAPADGTLELGWWHGELIILVPHGTTKMVMEAGDLMRPSQRS